MELIDYGDNKEKLLATEEIEFKITKHELLKLVDKKYIDTKEDQLNLDKHSGIIGLMMKLNVNPNIGIEEKPNDIIMRKNVYGENKPFIPYIKGIFSCFLEVLKDKILLFLIFAATVRLFFDIIQKKNQWFDFFAIIVAILIIVIVVGITNYSKDKMFAKFQIDIDHKDLRVLRNGMEIIIAKNELVVGDFLIVNSGDILPVDGYLIKSHSITLEIDHKKVKYMNIDFTKENHNGTPLIVSGSRIIKGFGTILVIVVGNDTVLTKRKIQNLNNMKFSQRNTKSDNLTNFNIDDEIKELYKNGDNKQESKDDLTTSNINDMKNNDFDANSYSPLQEKLEVIATFLSKLGLIAAFITALFITLIKIYSVDTIDDFNETKLQAGLEILVYGIVIIVVAIPEGLPLAVTLSLAFSINKMKEENTIIKNIEACENMASVNCICTDFSGILTKGEMKILSIYIEDKLIESKNFSSFKEYISEDIFNFFCESISVNSIAFHGHKSSLSKDKTNEYFYKQFYGDPVECALLSFLHTYYMNVDYTLYRNNLERQIIDCSAYSTDSKVCYTIITMDDKIDYVRLYVRGSPEALIDSISSFIGANSQLLHFHNKNKYTFIKNLSMNYLNNGYNPILVCYRDIAKDSYYRTRQHHSNNDEEMIKSLLRQLIFVCLINLQDELKTDVEKYIKDCHKAGIEVKIVTNQEKEAAKKSAEKCDILHDYSTNLELEDLSLDKNSKSNPQPIHITDYSKQVIDAQDDLRKYVEDYFCKKNANSRKSFEFRITDVDRLTNNIKNSLVICRATATDKFILGAVLRNAGYIVAVTGDGVSDFLSMNIAHVGISMGKNSSDMSKEVADVILMDDNFRSIITAIIYGRNIYDSVRKFLQFQISGNIVTIFLVIFSSFWYVKFNIFPSHLLWLNLILDTFGSLSLATEPPAREEILKKSPYNLNENIITNSMVIFICVQSFIQSSILVILILFAPTLLGISDDRGLSYTEWEDIHGYHTTIVFNVLIIMQIFNALNSRNLDKDNIKIWRNIHKHTVFILIQSLILISQLLLINYGGLFTRTRPLSLYQNLFCFLIASLTLFTWIIVRSLPNKYFENIDMFSTDGEYSDIKQTNHVISIRRQRSEYGLTKRKKKI